MKPEPQPFRYNTVYATVRSISNRRPIGESHQLKYPSVHVLVLMTGKRRVKCPQKKPLLFAIRIFIEPGPFGLSVDRPDI